MSLDSQQLAAHPLQVLFRLQTSKLKLAILLHLWHAYIIYIDDNSYTKYHSHEAFYQVYMVGPDDSELNGCV